MKKRHAFFMKLVLCLFICASAVTPLFSKESQNLTRLDEYIQLKMARDHVPGLAACLIKDDQIVWAKGYGWANTSEKIPMTASSVFCVASISKLVTATAVMQLAEKGLLDISSPINTYLPFKIQHPDFPGENITIAQLLNHTASTSNGPSLWRTFACRENATSLAEWAQGYFVPGGKFYDPDGNFARFKPGEGFQYSNAGYGLLAFLVEQVAGTDFNDYCREHIFAPLGMTNTSFNISGLDKKNLATMYSYGYGWDLERDLIQQGLDRGAIIQSDYFFPLCAYTSPTFAGGGLYTSAGQLAKFLIALMNEGTFAGRRILTQESLEKMFGNSVSAPFLPDHFAAFGLGGYAMQLANGEPVLGHTGADPGTSTYMLFNPEIHLGAIVLANRFVDIRDMIEWLFAEGFAAFNDKPIASINKSWRQYSNDRTPRDIRIVVKANYLPGGSQLYIIGNHRFLGNWIRTGVPLSPQKDGTWAKSFSLPDSTQLEFKITRGSWDTEAVNADGSIPPNFSFMVTKDSVVTIKVEDWKDLVQD